MVWNGRFGARFVFIGLSVTVLNPISCAIPIPSYGHVVWNLTCLPTKRLYMRCLGRLDVMPRYVHGASLVYGLITPGIAGIGTSMDLIIVIVIAIVVMVFVMFATPITLASISLSTQLHSLCTP